MDWHLTQLSEILKQLDSPADGLSNASVSKRLQKYGPNLIIEVKKKTAFRMFLNQFLDFMILILIIAAVVSGFLGDITDAAIIIAIVFLNAIVGFIQEYRAEKAMEALKKMASITAVVLRNGKTKEIPASELVPGDIIQLEVGDIIPADIRFIEAHQVKADESALTGESNNVHKNSDELPSGDYPLGDQLNMGFKGTHVTNGRAKAIVVETGMNTELGKIAKLVQSEGTTTPLQKRLTAFGKRLSVIILFICVGIFVIGWIRGESLITMLLTSISLAVAAIPEALPALVTIALAFGAKRLVKNKALIRKLPAVETLGSVTFICTDKTGTLTKNEISVQEIFESSVPKKFKDIIGDEKILLYAMALSNDVTKKGKNDWKGESTEVALAHYADQENVIKKKLETTFPRVGELPFDSDRKCMTTLHKTKHGILVITKGASEILLDKLSAGQKSHIKEFESKANEMSEKGYRVLGFAIKMIPKLPKDLDSGNIEKGLTFIGYAGMIDPPRKEAKEAVEQCKNAGITAVMITGDHKLTAQAIARDLRIISNDDDLILDGIELGKLSDREFKKIVQKVRVYARVNPEQKLKIIKALQAKHHIVAMTGDGVNDAPALKNADIGIAMGINGTEVSKEASHMILLDDNFATIVVAVKYGRKIFDNILKFIKYILSCNLGEICAILLAPFFGLPIPLLAIHILWINLVTDGLPGLALAAEPSELKIMERPPKNSRENIFSGGLAVHIIWVGILMGIVTIAVQAWAIHTKNDHWQTMTFSVLCFSQLGHVMAIRSDRESLFKIGIFSNKPMILALVITILLQLMIIYTPFFNDVFKTQPLSIYELSLTIAISSIVFWLVELEKIIKRMKWKKKTEKGNLKT